MSDSKNYFDLTKAVFFTDIHIHPWEGQSKITEDMLNSRLVDGIDTLKMIINYAIKKRIRYVIFGGDLFHKRNEVNIVAMNLVQDAFREGTDGGLQFHMILGNHDQAFNTKYDSLFFLDDINVDVYSEHCVKLLQGFGNVSFHPWNDNRIQWREDYLNTIQSKSGSNAILSVMHFDFQDIEYRGNYIGSGTKSSVLAKHPLNISGHYHDYNRTKNLIYAGAPLHHNWGDAGKDRGFFVLKAEHTPSKYFTAHHGGEISWRRIINERSPKFVEVYDRETVTEDIINGNYVRVYQHMFDTKQWIEIYKEIVSYHPRSLEVIDLPKLGTPEEVDIENFKVRNVEDIIKSYVKSSGTPLSKKKLIEFGKEFTYSTRSNLHGGNR